MKFFNKATAPTLGTDTPLSTLVIASGQCVPMNAAVGGFGLYFSSGIAFAITNGGADADTSAVGSGDVVLNLTYV